MTQPQSQEQLTEEDLFELHGVGRTGVGRSVLRIMSANVNRAVRELLARRSASYDRGYAQGYEDGWWAHGLGTEVK